MSKGIADKIRQATAKVKNSFFKPKHNQQNNNYFRNSPQQQQTNKSDAQQVDSRWKSFATMAQQQIKNVNRVQLDYMKKKLSDYNPSSSNILRSIKEQASGLKDSNLKESLKDGTNKLKDTSKQAIQVIKNQAKKLQGAKEQLQDVLKKINPINQQQGTKQIEMKKQRDEPKEEKTLKWFHRQMHNSQQNWKSMQEMIQRQLKTSATSRFNLIQRLFQRLYWKTVTLVCLIVFFYAFGSSVPREIRKLYEQSQKNEGGLQEKGHVDDKERREKEKKEL